MVLPKIEPGTETESTPITTIPLSVLTGDPNQTQLVAVNANGQVMHVSTDNPLRNSRNGIDVKLINLNNDFFAE